MGFNSWFKGLASAQDGHLEGRTIPEAVYIYN